MNVFPDDRLQTAEEWLERIDTVQRQAKKLVEAQNDRKLEESISQLVASVNIDVIGDGAAVYDKENKPDFVRDTLNVSPEEGDPSRPSFVGRLFGWMRGKGDAATATSEHENEAEK